MSRRAKISLQDLSDFVEDDEGDQYEEEYNDRGNDFFESRAESLDNSNRATPVDDAEMQHVISQVVRLALSRELAGKNIRSDNIAKYIRHNFGRKVTTGKLIEEANAVLKLVYGLTIEDVSSSNTTDKQKTKPEKEQPATKMRKTASSKGPYIIVSNLLAESRNILGELWNRDLRTTFKRSDLGGRKFFLPDYERTLAPGANYDLVKTGIMLVVISMVILNENHIQETTLFRKLRKFGILDDLNRKNSNINMNAKDLLNDLTQKEYLLRKKLKGRTELEDIFDYSLGKRSLVEFSPQGVFEYIKMIYGDNYDSNIAERALVTIERAYGVAVVEANESTNNNDGPSEEPSEQSIVDG
ncbi:Non-structural maintenance of chromosome element 3 [Candida viswanathii]|uniref:Non-structural maintenance of chromosome element 3 n=1 Tax=Candida viswanathii TaxID=5486 RepID=A0A367Y0C7_9ASCO|nr:Non-structural maintenance of chromosome element 3 [Candida viswanathii]